MDENRQIQLSEINTILQVLQSIVSQSFLSTSRSENPEEVHLAANIFPVISCFSKVIQFVNEGFVHVPQPLVEQFLEVAQILQIVHKDVKEDFYKGDVGVDEEDTDVGEEDLDVVEEDLDVGDEDPKGDEELRHDLWWDDGPHQYQLYWGDEDDAEDDDCGDVFVSELSEEDEEDYSVAHRVMVRRRARLGATAAAEVTPPPPPPGPTSPKSATSPSTRARKTETKRDPLITALLRTINRTAPKSVYCTKKAEILRKERSDIRIANIVPNEFKALWDAHEDEEDFKINVQDPYPTIDWSKVNKRFISNIPEPTRFPIHSCSPDPAFYEWTEKKINGAIEKIPSPFERYHYYLKKGWFEAAKGMHAFGSRWGYDTSEGIVSVASLVHHGYIWQNGWILHAQKPNLEEKIIRKRDSEDCKFQSKKKFGGRKRAAQNLSFMPD